MVTVPKEKSFPRGGHVERTDVPRRKIPDWCQNKLSIHKKRDLKTKQKALKLKGSAKTTYEENEVSSNDKSTQIRNTNNIRPYTGALKYAGISEGMLILGCIYNIEPYKLGISLPGNCIGYVPITNISEPYRQALASLVSRNVSSDIHHLRDMFRVGQHVVTKVVKKEVCAEDDANRNKIVLSLSPQDVHSEWSSRVIRAQSVFTAAVISIEEKVYVMDLGIKSVRAVLKKENAETYKRIWNENKELGIGQLVRCVVLSVTKEKSLSTVMLSADPYAVTKASCNKIGSALGGFLPGMLFNVTVARHLFKSGIQVHLSENVVGYVPDNHFPRDFRNAEDFHIGSVHPARVLYISKSGAIFFTMKKNVCLAQPPVSPFKSLQAGFIAKDAVVWRVSETGLTVKLAKSENVSFKGLIPSSHLYCKSAAQNLELPISAQLANEFPVGSEVTCRVMDYCYMDQYYVCTMKKSLLKETYLHPSSLKVGVVVSCIIKEINSKGISVTFGKHSPLSGFVPKLHMADVPITHPEKKFSINQTCTARVLRLDNCIHLTMKQSLVQSTTILISYDSAEVGKRYLGTVVQRNLCGIMVEFFSNITGWVNRPYLSKMPLHPSAIESEFYLGKVVSCTVIQKENTSQKLILSLIATDMLPDLDCSNSLTDDWTNEEKKVQSHSEGNENVVETVVSNDIKMSKRCKKKLDKTEECVQTVSQVVSKLQEKRSRKKSEENIDCPEDLTVSKKKLKITTESTSNGGVESDVSGKRSKNTSKVYCVGGEDEEKYVETKTNSKRKKSNTAEEDADKVNETKKKRKLRIAPTEEISTVGTKKELNSTKNRNTASHIQNNDTNFEITSEVASGKKVKKNKNDTVISPTAVQDNSVNLKSSVGDEQSSQGGINIFHAKSEKGRASKEKNVNKSNHSNHEDGFVISEMSNDVIADGAKKKKRRKRKNCESKDKNAGIDSSEPTITSGEVNTGVVRKAIELPSLSVKAEFVWDATPNSLPAVTRTASDDSSSDDDEGGNKTKKEKRSRQAIIAEKRLQAQLEEARLRSIEQRLMDPEQLPQTVDEFDRLVLASPDNSMVWLQYMAYHIQATEIDKARNVAKRALKTIAFREEQEKLNVWAALLNLENLYGTNDTVKSTLEEAVKLNDPYTVYTKMLQIYADSHKLAEGDELITAMVKKFKLVKDMWINVATFYMKSGQLVKARGLLQRALNNLEKKEHVSVISQFALLENKLGSQERAQTLMEQILTSYPKRVDVWCVYVDMLVKSNLISMARQVLERAVVQRLQAHKMKALFKKFLAFEETHGTEESADKVRQMALEYVEAATSNNFE